MIKLLIGGSPCTLWSVAKTNGRETKPEGVGWELFANYLIAKEKFKPDFFLYENNKSAAQPIKDQIANELGVGTDPLTRFTYVNSALVSAQRRERFYVTNFGHILQPEDRGILLKDILESGITWREKSVCIDANYHKGGNFSNLNKQSGQRLIVAEPVILNDSKGKAGTIRATCYKDGIRNLVGNNIDKRTCVAYPIRIGTMPNNGDDVNNSQSQRIYSIEGKSVCLSANGGGMGGKTGLYAIPVNQTAYSVRNGKITIKDKEYDIKLPDGYYIIRKLTVTECCRLQTMPDDYCKSVSATQGYKGLGNGWTAEVIIHLLDHALRNVLRDEKIVVLSMYDGIGTGRYCLDKMGFTNVEYHAFEIDKYAMTISNDNYPDIIQHGDAFQVREDDWLDKTFK